MNFSFFFELIGPVIFWFLKQWVSNQEKKKEFHESYFAFLAAVDKSGAIKAANHLAAQDALAAEQKKLLEEIENAKNK